MLMRIGMFNAYALLATATIGYTAGPDFVMLKSQGVFQSPSAVRFWLELRNPLEKGCSPIVLDPTVASHPPDVTGPDARRPVTVITLAIRDARGVVVDPRHKIDATPTMLRVHELVLLGCGQSYGWEGWLSRIPWGYELLPGRYAARARVVIPVASFLSTRETLKRELETLWGAWLRPFVRDVQVESQEVTFEVARAN
jgi:hypothetical protein